MQYLKYLPLFLFLLFLTELSHAKGENDFRQGVNYTKQQQFKKAAQAFEKALKQGMKTPALYHNLAIVYLKQKKFKQAEKYFKALRKFPKDRPLAEYNLGLLYKTQKNQTKAKKQFQLVKEIAKSSKLVTMARVQLGELKSSALAVPSAWSVYTSVTYGNDDNITTADDITATKESSTYLDLYAEVEYRISGTDKDGLFLTAMANKFDYSIHDTYDASSYGTGIYKSFPLGEWRNSLRMKFEDISFGLTDYQRQLLLEYDTKNYLGKNSRLRLRYRYYDLTSLDVAYDPLAGSRQRLRAEYKYYLRPGYVRFYIEHELNDRANYAGVSNPDPTLAILPKNYSPTRNTLRASYKHEFGNKLDLRADLAYRISNYDAYSTTAGTTVAREDKRTRYRLGLNYKLNKTWRLNSQYEYTDDKSSEADNSYKRNVTRLSAIANF